MDPTTILLLSLLAGAATTGYVAAAPHDRTLRATRGSAGAVRSGWTSGRATASQAFSKPPSGSQGGIVDDLGWFVKQLWGGLRVGGSFVRQLRPGYRASARNAQSKRNHDRANGYTPIKDRMLAKITGVRTWAGNKWHGIRRNATLLGGFIAAKSKRPTTTSTEPLDFDTVEAIGLDGTGTDGDPRFPYTEDDLTPEERQRLAEYRGNQPRNPIDALDELRDQSYLSRASHWWTDNMGREHDGRVSPPPSSALSGQNGASPVTAIADVPGLSIVQEFTSPGQMDEPLADLGVLAEQIAMAMSQLVEGLHDFINGYAEAKFSTGGLTMAVSSLVECIDDEGHVNVFTFAEKLAPIGEAIEEAKTLGEASSQIEAEGDVEAFKED